MTMQERRAWILDETRRIIKAQLTTETIRAELQTNTRMGDYRNRLPRADLIHLLAKSRLAKLT